MNNFNRMKDNLDIFRIKTNNVEPKKGRILIAEPFLPGTYFNRSVILLVAYGQKGAVGFILNKKVDVANVGPGDYVIDLGSGYGRMLIAAAGRGAYGHGVDLDP